MLSEKYLINCIVENAAPNLHFLIDFCRIILIVFTFLLCSLLHLHLFEAEGYPLGMPFA